MDPKNELTEREKQLMALAWLCFSDKPKVRTPTIPLISREMNIKLTHPNRSTTRNLPVSPASPTRPQPATPGPRSRRRSLPKPVLLLAPPLPRPARPSPRLHRPRSVVLRLLRMARLRRRRPGRRRRRRRSSKRNRLMTMSLVLLVRTPRVKTCSRSEIYRLGR
jgi:hypothetical protein